MTETLYREEPYRRETGAHIVSRDASGIVLDRTVFYPRGGGQAGDAGTLVLADGRELAIADTVKGEVERYVVPHLGALNFVLHDALGGGVTRSLALDAHGKCLSSAILGMAIE